MSLHIGQHLQGNLRCKLCEIEFPSYGRKIEHVKVEHPGEFTGRGTVCEQCGKLFLKKRSRCCHMYTAHKIPSLECYLCTKQGKGDAEKFAMPKDIYRHEREKHYEEIYICRKCEVHFVQAAKYTLHVTKCSKDEKCSESQMLQCSECSFTSSKRQSLNIHVQRVHRKEKNSKCELCDFKAYTHSSVRRHMAHAHLDLKRHQCELCPFSAVQPGQLKSHIRTHTKDKPFKCDQCSYAAAWNVQRKDHLKIHELASTVTCKKCGVVLKDGKALKRHESREHVGQ